ncbi:hypothetical protein [Mycoplasma sp. MV126]|uniref:hypothetical protein n=1 Tax=Mycoplasma sp. MV126 TaxID=3401676 RepID=UPI003AAA6820
MKKWLYSKILGVTSIIVIPSSVIAISCNKEDKELQEFNHTFKTNVARADIKNSKNVKLSDLIALSKEIDHSNAQHQKYFDTWIKPAALSIISSDEAKYNKQMISSYISYLKLMVNKFVNVSLPANYSIKDIDLSSPNAQWNQVVVDNQDDKYNYERRMHEKIGLLFGAKDPEIWKQYWKYVKDNFSSNIDFNILKNSKMLSNNSEISMWENLLKQAKEDPFNSEKIRRHFEKFLDWFPPFETKSETEKNLIINEFGYSAINTLGDTNIVWSDVTTKKVMVENKPQINLKAEIICKCRVIDSATLKPIIKIVNNEKTKQSVINIVLAREFSSVQSYANLKDFTDMSYKWNEKLIKKESRFDTPVTPLPSIDLPNNSDDKIFEKFKELESIKVYKFNVDINIPEPEYPISSTVVSYTDSWITNENDVLIDKNKLIQLSDIAIKLKNNSSTADLQVNDQLFKISSFTDDEISKAKDTFLGLNKK